MDFSSFDEFWKALGRLYEGSVKHDAAIAKLQTSLEELRGASQRLLSAVEKHQEVVESRERRLDRSEITVEAILEDLRRHREGRASQ